MSISPIAPKLLATAIPAVNQLVRLAGNLPFADLLSAREEADTRGSSVEATSLSPGGISSLELQSDFLQSLVEQELSEFLRQFHEQLEKSNIEHIHPFELESDGKDGVQVDGDHPQRAAIEELFVNNTELAGAFQRLAAAARAAERFGQGELHREFQLSIEGNTVGIQFR